MNSTKLTPLEILRRRKIRLDVKSDALSDILEDNFVYLQNNAISLLSESAVDALISKMPPFVQHLFGRKIKNSGLQETNFISSVNIPSIASGVLDFLPIFIRGKKGILATFLIKQVKRMLKK